MIHISPLISILAQVILKIQQEMVNVCSPYPNPVSITHESKPGKHSQKIRLPSIPSL